MGKIISIWNKVEETLIIILMVVMATVVFLQVVFRLLSSSLPWSEELSRYLTIWVSFIGASYGFRQGSHVGVEAFKDLFSPKPRKAMEFVGHIVCVILSALVASFGASIVQTQMQLLQLSPAMRIPMWIIYISIPIGFGLCALRNIELAVKLMNNKQDEGGKANG